MKCITIGTALVRVSDDFDETEGSDDMVALKALVDATIEGKGVPLYPLVTKHGHVERKTLTAPTILPVWRPSAHRLG